jgi:hypothetical protein
MRRCLDEYACVLVNEIKNSLVEGRKLKDKAIYVILKMELNEHFIEKAESKGLF